MLATEVEQGVHGSVRDIKRELRNAARQASRDAQASRWASIAPARQTPRQAPPAGRPAAELERRAATLLAEVRRLARNGRPNPEAIRAAAVVLDTALDQVRRLLR